MITLGIDIGRHGCFSLLSSTGSIIFKKKMPLVGQKISVSGIRDIFKEIDSISMSLFENVQVGLEKIYTKPSDTHQIRSELEAILELNPGNSKNSELTVNIDTKLIYQWGIILVWQYC